jgi:hypothetical protein
MSRGRASDYIRFYIFISTKENIHYWSSVFVPMTPRRNKLNMETRSSPNIFDMYVLGTVPPPHDPPTSPPYCCFTLLAAIKETLGKSLIYSVRSAGELQGSQMLPPVRAAVTRWINRPLQRKMYQNIPRSVCRGLARFFRQLS